MLGVAKKLRQEREREKELQAQKNDQRTAIQHIDQRVARMEAKLKERLQLHTVVEVEGLPQYVKKGELQKIQIATARKGAHNITRCTGLETFSIDPETMAQN